MALMALITTSLNKKKRIAFSYNRKRKKFSKRHKNGDAASRYGVGCNFHIFVCWFSYGHLLEVWRFSSRFLYTI